MTGFARALPLIALSSLLSAAPAAAFEFGAGVEAGGSSTDTSKTSGGLGMGDFGLILEQRWTFPLVFIQAWEDLQTPLYIQVGDVAKDAGYIPIGIGFRAGLVFGPIQPYIGILGQILVLSDRPTGGAGPGLNDNVGTLGGDFGGDLAILFLRLGLEFRFTNSLTDLTPSGAAADPGHVFIFQVLASVRASF